MSDDDGDAGRDAGPSRPRCTVGPTTMFAPVASADAGEADRFEAVTLVAPPQGARALLVDSVAHQLLIASSATERASLAIGPEPVHALSLVSLGAERALVFAVATQQRARSQRAYVLERTSTGANTLRAIATHRGLPDDTLGIATCAVPNGALVAWDESPTEGHSIVRVQRWTAEARTDPAVVTVSDPAHDASDPVLVATPDGGAIVAYLALEEVAVETANQSAADVIVRSLDANGNPRGPAINLTNRAKTRFGIALHVSPRGRWISWRLASDSDHEGLGDGGRVGIATLGDDLRPVRSPDYVSDIDRVPAGRIAIVSDGDSADVYWTERRGEELVSVRRTVTADGRITSEPTDEPSLHGQVPFAGDAREPRVAVWGPANEPGYVIARCPP